MILVIDNYDSFTYNLVQLIADQDYQVKVVRNNKINLEEIEDLNPSAIVLSPGPGTPKDSGICPEIVRFFAPKGIPILGICLGHQVIGECFGGKVARAPKPLHGVVQQIDHSGKGLFVGTKNPIEATRYHSLHVELEDEALLEITARSTDDVIMGINHKEYQVYGLQFHPESIGSPEGNRLLKNFLELTK